MKLADDRETYPALCDERIVQDRGQLIIVRGFFRRFCLAVLNITLLNFWTHLTWVPL